MSKNKIKPNDSTRLKLEDEFKRNGGKSATIDGFQIRKNAMSKTGYAIFVTKQLRDSMNNNSHEVNTNSHIQTGFVNNIPHQPTPSQSPQITNQLPTQSFDFNIEPLQQSIISINNNIERRNKDFENNLNAMRNELTELTNRVLNEPRKSTLSNENITKTINEVNKSDLADPSSNVVQVKSELVEKEKDDTPQVILPDFKSKEAIIPVSKNVNNSRLAFLDSSKAVVPDNNNYNFGSKNNDVSLFNNIINNRQSFRK